MDYRRHHKVVTKVARIFNTYGPRMHPNDGRVVSNFIMQALKNEPITVFGDGRQTRSFCFVSDLIEALVRLMAAPNGFSGPVNLGNPRELTILDLAQKTIQLTGSRSKIQVHPPLPSDDPIQRCPDISLAKAHLGWKPKVELEEGLGASIGYFERLLSGGNRYRSMGRKGLAVVRGKARS
jgi:UDP-glucuronate decarboxylase